MFSRFAWPSSDGGIFFLLQQQQVITWIRQRNVGELVFLCFSRTGHSFYAEKSKSIAHKKDRHEGGRKMEKQCFTLHSPLSTGLCASCDSGPRLRCVSLKRFSASDALRAMKPRMPFVTYAPFSGRRCRELFIFSSLSPLPLPLPSRFSHILRSIIESVM